MGSTTKKVFMTELTDLRDNDVEGLGILKHDEYGRIFRWVKNAGATDLVAAGVCLRKLGQTTPLAAEKRVLPADATAGPATCLKTMPAGVPITGIAASGATALCFGWIQVEGAKKVSMMQAATVTQQQAGCRAIATSLPTQLWGRPVTGVIDSTVGGAINLRCVEIIASHSTTGQQPRQAYSSTFVVCK